MSHLLIEQDDGVARVTLNRPDVHNAFNDVLIGTLTETFRALSSDDSVRVIVLAGAGRSFCAGADLNWMRSMAGYDEETNRQDSLRLAALFATIDQCPKPVIGRVQGAAVGGGVGLVAVCDIVIVGPRARFALSEVRLGLAPAVIAPYVVRKIGTTRARELFLTGARIDPMEAKQYGLAHRIVGREDDLDSSVRYVCRDLLKGGPKALAACKQLAREADLWLATGTRETTAEKTASIIAGLRVGDEGQEGMASFFEKRSPSWIEEED
jgi:methylglutaconyl-CoA hydratase